MAVQVGRLLKPSGVEVVDRDYHEFLHRGPHFPASGEKRASLYIGIDHHLQIESDLRHLLEQVHMSLSDEQVRDIALQVGITHEYGHAVARTVQILLFEKKQAINPQGLPVETWHAVDDLMNRTIFEKIAPDDELEDILRGEPDSFNDIYTNRGLTSVERIAAGFERLSLRFALTEAGLAEQQTKLIMGINDKENKDLLGEHCRFLSFANNRGLKLNILGQLLDQLKFNLEEKGLPSLAQELPMTFGAVVLGYLKPLTEDQLKNFIATFLVDK